MIDIADPAIDYSVADYVRDADAAIAAIRAQGRVPIVAGGTGMYLRGLLKGIVPAAPRDAGVRARWRDLIERFGALRAHRLLARLDPPTAMRIPPRDTQRLVRALELAWPPGETWSARLARSGTWERKEERYPAMKFGLDMDRHALAERLAARVDAFYGADLPGEVRRLLDAGLPPSANAFKGIGYREVLRALEEGRNPAEAKDAIVAATRRYAKRQRTWYRKEPGILWLDAGAGVVALGARIAADWSASASSGSAIPAC